MGDQGRDEPDCDPVPPGPRRCGAQGQQQEGAGQQQAHQAAWRDTAARPAMKGREDNRLEQHQHEDQVDGPAAGEEIGYWRLSISRQIIGVRISCMASSIFPPGQTMVFGRDMNESCSMDSR